MDEQQQNNQPPTDDANEVQGKPVNAHDSVDAQDQPIQSVQSNTNERSYDNCERNGAPEPPESMKAAADKARENSQRVFYRGFSFNANPEKAAKIADARRVTNGAIIMAIISLFLGGVILSCISIVFAVLGYFRMKSVIEELAEDPIIVKTLRRSSIVGLIIAVVAFVLNFASMMYIMPQVIQAIQTNDYTALFGSNNWLNLGNAGTGTSTGTSTWG